MKPFIPNCISLFPFWTLGLLCLKTGGQNAGAFEFSLNGGSLQYLESSYHYLGYTGRMGFDSKNKTIMANFGMMQPYNVGGFSQKLFFGSLGLEWLPALEKQDFISPIGGFGFGIFDEVVSNADTTVLPAIVLSAGLKIGGPSFGLRTSLDCYNGFYRFNPFNDWMYQPLILFMAGFYAVF
jgi:hypothetical protein